MPDGKLINMAHKPDGEAGRMEEQPEDRPRYPFGLSLFLGDEEMQKLNAGDLSVGEEVMVVAKARVSGVNAREEADGEMDRTADLQITDMQIQRPQMADAEKMFGGNNKS